MSDENKGGSDLDIFEGLGKKSAPQSTGAAVPPPPPGSGSHKAAKPANDMKKTLLGMPGPAPGSSPTLPNASAAPSAPPPLPSAPPSVPPPLPPEVAAQASRPSAAPATTPSGSPPPPPPPSGSMRATSPSLPPVTAPSRPPPPPGRGSLPSISSPPGPASSSGPASRLPPPPTSTRPAPAAAPTQPAGGAASPGANAASQTNGKKLEMDWDDDQEATHIFDKDASKEKSNADASAAHLVGPEEKPGERADLDAIMSSPPRTSAPPPPPAAGASAPPPPPPASGSVPAAPASLSGAFAALGATNGASSQALKSAPPPSQSMRSAPPPPPGTVRTPNPSTSTAPMPPPPPPPGQTTTAPMHMPPRPASVPPPPTAAAPSTPPAAAAPSTPPAPQMPPVARAMEATAVVPRQSSGKGGLWAGLAVAALAIGGVGVFMSMQNSGPGTLVINATDTLGKPVSGLEVYVDDVKRCDTSPCTLTDVAPGPHVVRVAAPGFEAPAPKGTSIEAGKSATLDLALIPPKSLVGTGVKVSGNQPGVKLWVDGKEIGTLPQEVKDLEAGDHKIRIAGSERYAPMEKTVSVGKNEMVDLGNVALKVLKGKVMFQLGTPGAKVYLVASPTNRKEIPQFPIAIDFEPSDRYELVATAPGYEELRKPISFDDGIAEKSFTIELTPKGQAAVQTTRATTTTSTPSTPSQSSTKSSTPSFLAGEGSSSSSTSAKPEKTSSPAATSGEAFLNINSIPPSTVVLDGKPLGPTPKLKVAVPAGSHTILFVNAEQSLKKSITVTVGAGETKPAFAKLKE